MQTKKRKSPSLRFRGYTDDWEERKLGEVYNFQYGQFNNNPDNGGQYPIYGANGIIGGYDEYNSENAIVIGHMGAYAGHVLWAEGKHFVTYNGTMGIADKSILNSNFGYYLVVSVNVPKLTAGSGQPFVSYSDLNGIKILIPTIEEQQKIGSFFKQLDNTIALHQRKLDLLKEQKKGYLQKMFPKNGAKVPELRFEGFADDWELRKSKELCTISTGKGNTQDKVDDGAYPFYVRSATIEKSDEYLYDQEAVLTVGDGVGTGKVYHYVNGKYNLHQRVYRMYDFKDVSAKYFYYYFSKNFYKRVMSMTAKTSVDSVRMEMIADMNIVFPSVKEQENIVELFSNLDNTIALHQRKLDLLKEQKKGFLQKMFV